MTFFKLLKCTVAKPPICCSCFCNEQLNKNVKCGKEYFTLNVSNIVLVIFKSFITFCWEKKRIKKSHIKSQSQYFGKKSQLDYFPKSFSPNSLTSTGSWILLLVQEVGFSYLYRKLASRDASGFALDESLMKP